MKKIIALTFATIALLAISSCSGTDEKKLTDKSVKVWGNCDQCKATIEKAGKIDGVNSINWDENSKLLTLSIDTSAVSMDAVLKSVAAAGYDNELYKAGDEAYAGLPECCQYERKP